MKAIDNEFQKGSWFGNTDANTSNSCFFFSGDTASDIHYEQWQKVIAALTYLASVRDGNEDFVLEFVYRHEDKNFIVAYRFTSDWAYRQYDHTLTAIGGSLGRGVFDPFSPDSYLMDKFVIQD